jgi:hypothetical protein
MSKVPITFDDDDGDTNILVDERFADGGAQGMGFDQLGGFEFVTDTILFPSFQADTGIDVDGWYLTLEDGDLLLLESGEEILLEAQA